MTSNAWKDVSRIESKLTVTQNMNYSQDFDEIRDAGNFDELQETAYRLCHQLYELISKNPAEENNENVDTENLVHCSTCNKLIPNQEPDPLRLEMYCDSECAEKRSKDFKACPDCVNGKIWCFLRKEGLDIRATYEEGCIEYRICPFCKGSGKKQIKKELIMKKYRKKPIIIEPVQYTEFGKLVEGMCKSTSCRSDDGNDIAMPHVHTIHDNQVVILEVGDWVIPEPDGEHFYPCKPDIFEEIYEAVE